MTKALENANKLRAWIDPVVFGADPDGVTPSDVAFAQAIATGLPIRVSRGVFRFVGALATTLAAGQDFAMTGAGPEASRLVFDAGGLSVTYAGDGRSFGDASTIKIDGIGLETSGAGIADALRLINTASAVVNDTEGNVTLSDLSISGTTSAAYWATGIYLENVSFSDIQTIKVEDGAKRTTALFITTTGNYAAVDTTVDSFKCWEVATAVKVRGRSEGVYLNHLIVIGGETGIDWVATVAAGAGKKPLLLLDNSHINVAGTAVRTVDVAQVMAASTLIYIGNQPDKATYAFDFQATSGLSSENSRIDGCTIIGQGARAGALSTAVRCGANVFGVAIDATVDNVATCVETLEDNRTAVSPGSRLTNYNVRHTGMWNVAKVAGGISGGVSVDSSLQMEVNGAESYERDIGREQLRARSFIFTASAASETITHDLTRPFRTDTCMLVACFGATPGNPSAFVYPDLPGSTASQLSFKTAGLTVGAPYRVNYIAYGY